MRVGPFPRDARRVRRLFKAFDEAYKRTQKSELTAKIAALDKERDGYAYVIQKVAEAWVAKIEDESLSVHGVRVSQVFRDYGFRTSEALVAENAKIHNMEQKLAERDLVADLAKIDLQYQQSRKKGGKDDEPTPETETAEEI